MCRRLVCRLYERLCYVFRVYLHIYKVFSLNKIALPYIYCYKTLQAESGKFKKQSQHYEVGLVVEEKL